MSSKVLCCCCFFNFYTSGEILKDNRRILIFITFGSLMTYVWNLWVLLNDDFRLLFYVYLSSWFSCRTALFASSCSPSISLFLLTFPSPPHNFVCHHTSIILISTIHWYLLNFLNYFLLLLESPSVNQWEMLQPTSRAHLKVFIFLWVLLLLEFWSP